MLLFFSIKSNLKFNISYFISLDSSKNFSHADGAQPSNMIFKEAQKLLKKKKKPSKKEWRDENYTDLWTTKVENNKELR